VSAGAAGWLGEAAAAGRCGETAPRVSSLLLLLPLPLLLLLLLAVAVVAVAVLLLLLLLLATAPSGPTPLTAPRLLGLLQAPRDEDGVVCAQAAGGVGWSPAICGRMHYSSRLQPLGCAGSKNNWPPQKTDQADKRTDFV
jgi:hypothetical protein